MNIKELVSQKIMLVGYLTRPSENQTKPSQNQNVDKMSLENYPLPPHILGASRKRAASDSKQLARKVHIQVGRSTSTADELSAGVPVSISTLNCQIITVILTRYTRRPPPRWAPSATQSTPVPKQLTSGTALLNLPNSHAHNPGIGLCTLLNSHMHSPEIGLYTMMMREMNRLLYPSSKDHSVLGPDQDPFSWLTTGISCWLCRLLPKCAVTPCSKIQCWMPMEWHNCCYNHGTMHSGTAGRTWIVLKTLIRMWVILLGNLECHAE